jgi:hypothetical protein
MKIVLKPLKFKIKPTLLSQIHKCEEEDKEFLTAIVREDVGNAIEEFHDKITSSLNALRLLGIPIEIIANGQDEHFKKLIERGWNFEEDA